MRDGQKAEKEDWNSRKGELKDQRGGSPQKNWYVKAEMPDHQRGGRKDCKQRKALDQKRILT